MTVDPDAPDPAVTGRSADHSPLDDGPAPAPVGAVVAVGGGHGLAASLRAIRRYAVTITAVVSVADDGGSSGRLRQDFPLLPAPGDARRCLGALAEPDSELASVLEHRFGDDDGMLAGHAYGNLLLAALTFGLGSFGDALAEVGRMTGGVGAVLPATDVPVQLTGRALEGGGDGKQIVGQVAVARAIGRRYVALEPTSPTSPPAVREAILAADQVVIGPGSLFTSVLAAAIVPAVRGALHDTRAQRVYVANLAPQVPETAGLDLADHLRVLAEHDIPIDVVLAPEGRWSDDGSAVGDLVGTSVVTRPLASAGSGVHDPAALAFALGEIAGSRRPAASAPPFAAPGEVN
jgi:uncharacterized cofD-like protein